MAGRGRLGVVVLVVLGASLPSWAGGKLSGRQGVGLIVGPTSVLLNGQPAAWGATVFAGDVLETGPGSGATLSLRSGAQASLAENSEVAVPMGAEGGDLNLRRGALVVWSGGGEATRVSVQGRAVQVRSEGGWATLCRMAAVGRGGAVINERGRVEILGAGGGG